MEGSQEGVNIIIVIFCFIPYISCFILLWDALHGEQSDRMHQPAVGRGGTSGSRAAGPWTRRACLCSCRGK